MPSNLNDELLWALSLKKLKPVSLPPNTPEADHISWVERSVEVQQSSFSSRSGTEHRFVVTDSLLINGKAWTHNITNSSSRLRISTVTAGGVLGPPLFFHYLMSRSDVLPDMGNGGELSILGGLEIRPTYPMVAASNASFVAVSPADPVRREFAHTMSATWCQFIATHELAHSLCGHTIFESREFTEIARPSGGTIRAHTLEMSADCIAAGNVLERMLLSHNGGHLCSAEHMEHIKDKIFYPLMLAISLMLRVMSERDLAPGTLANAFHGSHPHLAYRRHMLAIVCGRILARFYPGVDGLEGEAANLSVKAGFDAHAIWCSVTGKQEPRTFWMFGDNYEEVIQDFEQVRHYQALLLEEWKVLRPLLEPHAIWELPPA